MAEVTLEKGAEKEEKDDAFAAFSNKVVSAFFNNRTALTLHQLSSYEYFLTRLLPEYIVNGLSSVRVYPYGRGIRGCNAIVEFTNINITRPEHMSVHHKQKLTPMLARRQNYHYCSPLTVDLRITIRDAENQVQAQLTQERVELCQLHVMVGSMPCFTYKKSPQELLDMGECPFDQGGYFIVKGKEKVIISRDRQADKRIFTHRAKKTDAELQDSVYFEKKPTKRNVKPTILYVTEIKSTRDQRFFPVKVFKLVLTSNLVIWCMLPYQKELIPITVLFRALGVTKDRDIATFLGYFTDATSKTHKQIVANTLKVTAGDANEHLDALRRLSQHLKTSLRPGVDVSPEEDPDADPVAWEERVNSVYFNLNRECLPHTGNSPIKKVYFVCHMFETLVRAYEDPEQNVTDRDAAVEKRIDTAGPLMFQLFRFNFGALSKSFRRVLNETLTKYAPPADVTCDEDRKKYDLALAEAMRRILENISRSPLNFRMRQALGTGLWQTSMAPPSKDDGRTNGTTQQLDTLNAMCRVTHTRRVKDPVPQDRATESRKLHATQVCKQCVNETPESEQVGTLANLAIMCTITNEMSAIPVTRVLEEVGLEPFSPFTTDNDDNDEPSTALRKQLCSTNSEKFYDQTKIFVNGDLLGLARTATVPELVEALTYFKLTDESLHPHTSISWKPEERCVTVLTDGGRQVVAYLRVTCDQHVHALCIPEKVREARLSAFSNLIRGSFDSLEEAKKLAPRDLPVNYTGSLSREHYWYQAPVEFVDADQEVSSLLAMRPRDLWNGQTYQVYGYGSADERPTILAGRVPPAAFSDPEAMTLASVMETLNTRYGRCKTVKQVYEAVNAVRVVGNPEERIVHVLLRKPLHELPKNVQYTLQNLNRFLCPTLVTYTHCVLSPAFIHGMVAAATIPRNDHNPSPRNTYQSAMAKQAIGTPFLNKGRFDSVTYVLLYPQVPISQSRFAAIGGMSLLPSSYNSMHLVLTDSFNQEDSLEGSCASNDCGAFAVEHWHTLASPRLRYPNDKKVTDGNERFVCRPSGTGVIGHKIGVVGSASKYHAIDTSTEPPHMPVLGTWVRGNDVVIPKLKTIVKKHPNGRNEVMYRDTSILLGSTEEGLVRDSMIAKDSDGYTIFKVKITNLKLLQLGDKLASTAAQKGVFGKFKRVHQNMFTGGGAYPDTIANAHSFPSRMTLGQLIESLQSKAALVSGVRVVDCTAFEAEDEERGLDLSETRETLRKYGYDGFGNELVYNGKTGRLMGSGLMAPTRYQRLRHFVSGKHYARARGPVDNLTRQPPRGRARKGGIRLGEMERDAICAHGSAEMLKDALMTMSDAFTTCYQPSTESFLTANPREGIYLHGQQQAYGGGVKRLVVPYVSTILMKQLYQCMINVVPRVQMVGDDDEELQQAAQEFHKKKMLT